MSRRESRVSMNVRQNDALFEFENFKKKFLLANKHITKLNSTLSVRIEDLNAQISTLYVENLRLRASEIALVAQLKREREKSQKVIDEAEAATLSLTRHLGYLRQTFNIKTSSPAPTAPPSPRARRPPPNPNPSPSSPQANRISRPPNVPGIYEEDEPSPASSEHEADKLASPAPHRKPKPKPRLSASRLPLPSPPPLLPHPAATTTATTNAHYVGLESGPSTAKSRKPARRQSGLLSVNTESLAVPRAASPAFGSPIRREAGLAEEEEMRAVAGEGQGRAEGEVEVPARRERRKSKGKEREPEGEREPGVESVRARERKKTRERDEDCDGNEDGGKPRLKVVTNVRPALSPIDNTVYDQADADMVATAARQFLGSSPAPTSRSSTSPPPNEGEGSAGGRERRTRKSVNYAEPKLNTKMRKPDPPTGSAPKKRSSAAAVLSTYRPSDDNGNDADNDTEARSSLELPLRVNGAYINPESFPLPPSRPASAASLFSPPPAGPKPPPSTASSSSSSSAAAVAVAAVKRKKSKPQMVFDEDESDGAQADAEYGVGRGGASGWVNVEGRRKAAAGGGKRNMVVLDDGRRHSMAV